MYPLFSTIESYRDRHLAHHQHLNTEEDPDWVSRIGKREFTFPKSKREFLLTLLSYLLLVQGIGDLFRLVVQMASDPAARKTVPFSKGQLMFQALVFSALTLGGLWKFYLLFWVVPYLSTFLLIQYIRTVAEHFGELGYDHALTSTRTVRANFLEKFFLAPHNVNYHLEHHLYPGVPFYNLPRLHQTLMENTYFEKKAHITHGYVGGLLNELGKVEQVQLGIE